ncbi:Fur-regulated basic protein FbpA [Priestia filamentosa]
MFEKGYIKEEYKRQLYKLTLSELEALYVKYAKEEPSI